MNLQTTKQARQAWIATPDNGVLPLILGRAFAGYREKDPRVTTLIHAQPLTDGGAERWIERAKQRQAERTGRFAESNITVNDPTYHLLTTAEVADLFAAADAITATS